MSSYLVAPQAHRAAFRKSVVDASLEELKRVANAYLIDTTPSIAVITNPDIAEQEAPYLGELMLTQQVLM